MTLYKLILIVPVGESCPNCQFNKIFQAKFRIGSANDKYEQEADRVAEHVMRMPGDQLSTSDNNVSLINNSMSQPGMIQRTVDESIEDEDIIQAKMEAEGAIPEIMPSIDAGIQSLQGCGQPLSVAERSFFEPRFEMDFSNIRVHSDTQAANVSQSINARAFTMGNNIVFANGEYSPNTNAGQKLMAHELTHTIQQSANSHKNTIQRKKSRCSGENTLNYLLKNYVDFEYTIPRGCRGRSIFIAKWVYDGDCCTGMETYEVIHNGTSHSLPVGPNICGDSDAQPRVGRINVGSGRHQFRVNVNRRNCDGIKMELSVRNVVRR